jgi:hypothetical protein
MTRRRAKNLNDDTIGLIVRVLDGWTGKLSWDLLIDALGQRLRTCYTRQALDKHARIKSAFQVAKVRMRNVSATEPRSKLSAMDIAVLTQRFQRLEAEHSRLKRENDRLLEQFVTWSYNAHLKGLTKEYLNTPLPRVDRELTKAARRKSGRGQ